MNRALKLTAALLACLMAASCSAKTEADRRQPQQPVTEPATSAPVIDDDTGTPLPIASGVLPLITIQTESRAHDATYFAEKPVASIVSDSMAMWNRNYEKPPEPYYERCAVTLTDTDNSRLIVNAAADVKVRGNWTTNYKKKPLRIKFEQKQNMLGMNDGAEMKNWVLLAEYKDISMLRNKAALTMAADILGSDGLYSSDARLVEVEINGRYWGVYLLAEQQQVNKDRVNITEPEKDYAGTDIGYFLEYDGYYKNEEPLQSFRLTYADNAPLTPFDGNGGSGRTMCCLPKSGDGFKEEVGMTIKSKIYSQEQHDFIRNYMENVYLIMYRAAYDKKAYTFNEDFSKISADSSISPREAVEKVVDVQSLVDTYILSELTCDADIYWSSFYMDVDFGENGGKKLRFEAPWDFDSAMGNKDRCIDGTGFYAANIVPDVNAGNGKPAMYSTINPWLAVLIYEDWFQDMIREKWTAVYDGGTFDRTLAMIREDTGVFRKAFSNNYERWSNLRDRSEFEQELSQPSKQCGSQVESSNQLYDWLESRVAFLNENWHK